MADSNPLEIPEGAPDERVDSLYGLPLDEFTSSRDALAKELRAAGQRQQADWVKALRKPSAAAWAVNQLARTQAQEATALLKAGDQLRATHEGLLAGDAGADDLRRAAEEESKAARALLERAPGLLDREGQSPSPSVLEKATQTVRAVALDEETRSAFALGRLTREARATGLGPFGDGAPVPPAPPRGGAKKQRPPAIDAAKRRRATDAGKRAPDAGERTSAEEKKAVAERRAKAREALKQAKTELRARKKEVGSAEREVAKAQREAERAGRELERATSGLNEARAAEAEADEAVRRAEAGVDAAG